MDAYGTARRRAMTTMGEGLTGKQKVRYFVLDAFSLVCLLCPMAIRHLFK